MADGLLVAIGVGTSAVLDFATLVTISRWLGPAAFGTYGVYLVLMILVGGISDLGLSVILTKRFAGGRRRSNGLRDPQVILIFRLKAGIAALLVTAGAALFISGLFTTVSVEPTALTVAFIGAAALSMSTWISAWFLGRQQFGANALYSVAISGAKLAAVAVLCVAGRLSPVSALTTAGAVNIAAVCIGFAFVPRPEVSTVDRATFTSLWHLARWVGLWSILGVAIPRVDILMVRALGDSSQTGHYLAAARLCAVLALANAAANTILLPKLSRLKTITEVRRSLSIWTAVVAAAVIGILLPAELFAPQLVALVYGSAYEQSVVLFRILIVGSFLEFSLNPFAYAALAVQQPAAMTLSHAARLTLLLLFAVTFTRAFGVVGIAMAVAGSAILALGGLAVFVLTRTTIKPEPGSPLQNEYTVT